MARKKKKAAKLKTPKPKTTKTRPETRVCPACRCSWEGAVVALVGLLTLVDNFGLVSLAVIKWSILGPVILLVLGLLMITGIGKR